MTNRGNDPWEGGRSVPIASGTANLGNVEWSYYQQHNQLLLVQNSHALSLNLNLAVGLVPVIGRFVQLEMARAFEARWRRQGHA